VIVVIVIIATSGTAAGAAAVGGSAGGGSSGSAAAIGSVGAAGAGAVGVLSDKSDKSDTPDQSKHFDPSTTKQPIEIPSIPYPFNSPNFSQEAPLLSSIIDKQTTYFQGKLNNDQFFPPSTSGRLSWKETGNVLAPLIAHQSYQELQQKLPNSPQLVQELQKIKEQMEMVSPNLGNELAPGHLGIDQIFSSDNSSFFSTPLQGQSFESHVYKSIGEKAFDFGYHQQAAESFGKAIALRPTDNITYLQRGASYFHLGDYEKSMLDFQSYVKASSLSKTVESFVLTEFTRGFSKGFPKGIYESGEGIVLFLTDFITHPIHTSSQVMEAFATLAKLAKDDEWGLIAKTLAPEIVQLAKEWDSIPSDKRGELAGYALGKHGTDILAPTALAKVASSAIKTGKEVTAVCKNLKLAKETLLLETATGMGSSVQVGEIVSAGKITSFLGEELGFTAKEMGQLKKVGNLETKIYTTYEHLSLPAKESIKLFKDAGKKLKSYQGMYMSEFKIKKLIHETGIPTFAKPKGIPENYRAKLSKKPGGMKYVHPKDEGTYVRVMPGKSHSKNPLQQKPYVNHRINGKSVDKHGNIVLNRSEEAHIALEEFIFRQVK